MHAIPHVALELTEALRGFEQVSAGRRHEASA